MEPDGLSRRSLLTLRMPWRDAPPSAPAVHRWPDGAPALVRALEPLAGIVCDTAAVGPGRDVLAVGAGEGVVAREAKGRGAVVHWCAHTELDELPHAAKSFDAVVSLLGVSLAPRPRHAGSELVRVLRPDGMLVLAVPTPRTLVARVLKMAGTPGPISWSEPEAAARRLPGAEVELRTLEVEIEFPSFGDAWDACAGPFGLPDGARDRFADMIAAHSSSAAAVVMQDRWRLVLARRTA